MRAYAIDPGAAARLWELSVAADEGYTDQALMPCPKTQTVGGPKALPPARVADGTRTRDSQDHNLVLYQLNYSHHCRLSGVDDLNRIRAVKPNRIPSARCPPA